MCLPFFIAPLPSSPVLAFISFFLLLHYAFRGFRWSGCYRSYNDIRTGANVSGQYPINAPIAGTGENGRDSWEVESHHQSVWRTSVTAWHHTANHYRSPCWSLPSNGRCCGLPWDLHANRNFLFQLWTKWVFFGFPALVFNMQACYQQH